MALPYSLQDVLHSFPFPSFRKHQQEVVERVYGEFSAGVRTVLLEAPTGFGKSPVNMAFALAERNSFYTTPLLHLQDQLEADFGSNPGIRVIKGRNNYKCASSGYKATCNVGECQLKKEVACPYKFARVRNDDTEYSDFVPRGCPYWDAKIAAINADVAISNFAYLLSEGHLRGVTTAPVFGRRALLVVDEGHNIAEVGIQFVSVTLSPRTLPVSVRLQILETIPERFRTFEEVKPWAEDALEVLRSRRDYLNGMRRRTEEEVREQDRVNRLVRRLAMMLRDREADAAHEWVWDTMPGEKVQFRPVTVGRFLNDLLWWRVGREGRIIVSSATILDSELFAKEAGLPGPVSDPIRVPSTFPVEHRPIVVRARGRMSYYEKKETLEKRLLPEVCRILINDEKGHRGIIHCHSYDNLVAARKILGHMNQRLLYHDDENRNQVFKEWLGAGGDKVLVSVAFGEGVDLKDDLARFQIIMKTPYLPKSDKRIRKRMHMKGGQRWYDVQALKTLIQAYGRTTRSEEDWSTTYILDSCVFRLVGKNQDLCPDWFLEAFYGDHQGFKPGHARAEGWDGV